MRVSLRGRSSSSTSCTFRCSIVLALGVGTHVQLGLFGAGLSSLLSECVGAIYCIIVTMRRPQYRILEELDIDFSLCRATTLLALPEFVMLVLLLVPDALTVAFLAPLGAVAVAAFRAFTIVTDVTWAVPGAFGDSMQIIIGQRLGAGDTQGAQDFLSHATRLAVLVGTIVGVIFAVLAWPLTALVTLSPMLANVAALPLALHLTTLPIKSYAIAVLSPIRAAGDTRFSMWTGIIGAFVAVTIVALLTHVLKFGLYAIGIAWIASWSVRSIITTVRLRRGDWMTRQLPALAGLDAPTKLHKMSLDSSLDEASSISRGAKTRRRGGAALWDSTKGSSRRSSARPPSSRVPGDK